MHDKQLSKTPLVVFKRKDYFLAIVHPFSPLLFFYFFISAKPFESIRINISLYITICSNVFIYTKVKLRCVSNSI